MFPSLAALGGTLGLLGLREPGLVGDGDLADLNRGYQRHIDSCPVDYAALMRNAGNGLADWPIAAMVGDFPPQAQVVLVGGGIANIIAAYELSRVGIRCTVLEASDRIGGRLRSYRQKDTSTAWSEEGAVRFPRGGLMWHYVAQWVRGQGFEPLATPFQAASFPSPGTVPTMLAYQGETYDWSPTLDNLPPIVREARALFADFIAGLNDGVRSPDTVYFADAVRALKSPPDPATTQLLGRFWQSMLKQYDGRSCAEVLQTEVFATGSKPPDLMATFGTMGVGTGGFSHLYDAAFLEVLRVLLWDISEEFMLPEEFTYPDLFGPDEGGAWGFAMGLARAALAEAQMCYPDQTFDEMFQVNAPVTFIEGGRTANMVVHLHSGDWISTDFVIVAMTSRAMQQVQLDLPYPDNPLLTPLLDSDLVRQSCQAAIKRLDVVSGYRMNAELPSPRNEDTWPQDADGNKVLCFVTDERPRLAYVLPEVPADEGLVRFTAVDAYGADAHKLAALQDVQRRQESTVDAFTFGLQPDGSGGDGAAKPVADLLEDAAVHDIDWGAIKNMQGAFKVDKPADNYLSSSLFYHYQLAAWASGQDTTNIFFSGDSVGHLGGWVEGAAMSAINAVVGVCSRVEQREPDSVRLFDRFRPLLDDDFRLFHHWWDFSGQAPSKAGLTSMVRLGNRQGDSALPPRWRYLGKTSGAAYHSVTVSKPGDFMVAMANNELVFATRNPDGQWGGVRAFLSYANYSPMPSISVASEKGDPLTQLMFLDKDSYLRHGTYDNGAWSQFERPWYTRAKHVALDVEGGHAQVVVVDANDQLLHGIRFRDRSWSTLMNIGSPSGRTVFDVWDAAVSCTSFDQDKTTVAAIDKQTWSVYVAIRGGSTSWGPWVELPSPRPAGAEEPLRAVKVRVVVLDDANNAQVWAQFTDNIRTTPDRLYTSVRNITADPSGLTWTEFRPVPYPLSGAAGPLVDFAPTLPLDSSLEPDWPGLSTVVYAQIASGFEADQADEDDVSQAPVTSDAGSTENVVRRGRTDPPSSPY